MYRPTIHFVGDSISMHYDPYLARFLQPWADYSRKGARLGTLEPPAEANGGDSTLVLAYLRQMQGAGIAPDYIAINCGLHDLKTDPASGKKQVELGLYERNLRAISAYVRALPSRMIWLRTTPVVDDLHNRPGLAFHRHAEDVAAYNRVADAIMAQEGIPTIDLHTFTATLGREAFCDHVHYREEVRAQQAAYIAGALQRLLGSTPEETPFVPPRITACVGAVVLRGERVLLVRQAEGALRGQWSLPWGFVEGRAPDGSPEPPDLAALRETQEEAGVTAQVEGLLGIQNHGSAAGELRVYFLYLCRHVAGEPAPDQRETDRAAYFSLAELDGLREPVEELTAWLARRVLRGQYRLLAPLPANPYAPHLAFG